MVELSRRTLLASAPSTLTALAPAPAAKRPNFLVIISDQFRADNLGCMGLNPMHLTPNLDALAASGVLFRQAFVAQPVCAPARASLFTGQYPEKHGVWHNGLPIDPHATTIATAMRSVGYSANYIGKWHLAPGGEPDTAGAVEPQYRGGFQDLWEAANALEHTSHAYEGAIFDNEGAPVRFSGVYRSDFLTDRAIRFLKQRRTEQPFLLCVSYLETHHQNDSDTFQPPKQYASQFRNPFVPQDLRPLPGSWPSQLADYYGCVKGIDDTIGRLLASLREEGLENDTLVVFTSDHGCHFKTRNNEYKRSPHESSIHVPLIIAGPGFKPGGQPQQLVSHLDLAPTLLAAANLEIPATMQGRRLQPLLDGKFDGWQNEIYIGMREFVTGRVLRTPQWTYAVAAPKRPNWKAAAGATQYVEYMLYDLFADPHQHTNLAGFFPMRASAAELRERLAKRIIEAGDVRPDIEPAWFPYV